MRTNDPIALATFGGERCVIILDDLETVAWTHLYGSKRSRIAYASLENPDDFQNPEFRHILVNGVARALGR